MMTLGKNFFKETGGKTI